MRQVLLPVYTAGHFTELVRVARLLKTSARYAPTFWFSRSYHGDLARDQAVCREQGIASVTEGAPIPAAVPEPGARGPAVRGARQGAMALARALSARLPFPATGLRAIARQALELSRCRRLIAGRRPDLLILAEDSVTYETAALIKAAHERQIRSIIVPFTICNALEPAEAYFHDPGYGTGRWENRLISRLYPHWVYRHRGRTMIRMPAPQVMAKELFGLAPPLPWQMNSGWSDAIAVESTFMREYYRREGLPPEQLVLTGAPSDDVLSEYLRNAATHRAALCAELCLPPDRRLIVCALPPDQFSIRGPQVDVPDYPSLVRQWAQTLAAIPDCNVVVRFHPRTNLDAHRDIEQWGVKISDRDTTTLIPLCDLFVASVSATIRWAIACGKPTVNYDVYRYRWADFDSAPGVIGVEDQAAFSQTVQRLMKDFTLYNEIRTRQEAEAPRWATLDGQAGARILQCVDATIAGGQKERVA